MKCLTFTHVLYLEISLADDLSSSDPKSSRFGSHYTVDEVTELFAPSPASVNAVKSWLVDYGIDLNRISLSSNKAWLQFDASVEELEQLLQTKYHYYEHVDGDRKHIGCEEYKIPAKISEHIDYVTPGVKLLATTGMSELRKKRDLAASTSRIRNRRPMPPSLFTQLQQSPRELPSTI